MYTKISHGSNFLGAALYDSEGLNQGQKKAKAGKTELLHTANLLSIDARGIAAEMQQVARYSRSHKPVWNIAMSAPEGIVLTATAWRQAAELNLRVLGVDPERYQYAIYRHRDTSKDHIHILLNSVPVDGGPALSRQFKARKAKNEASRIDQALGIRPSKGEGIRDDLSRRLVKALQQRPTTPAELQSDLATAGVQIEYKQNKRGIYGVTFQLSGRDHNPVKGSDLVIGEQKAKWSVISALLAANRAEYEAEIRKLKETLTEREIAGKNEVADVYEKRDIIRDAFNDLQHQYDSLKKDKRQVERERDEARNKPPQTVERVIEKKVSDPADRAEIERLKRENEELKRKLEAGERLIQGIRHKLGVTLTQAQLARLQEGKQLILSDKKLVMVIVDGQLRVQNLKPSAALPPTLAPLVKPTPAASQPAPTNSKQSSDEKPAFHAAFAKRIQDNMPYLSLKAFAQKVGNPYTVGPKLKLAWHQDEVWVTDGKNAASLKSLGFDPKQLNFSQLDLKNLKERSRSQGKDKGGPNL